MLVPGVTWRQGNHDVDPLPARCQRKRLQTVDDIAAFAMRADFFKRSELTAAYLFTVHLRAGTAAEVEHHDSQVTGVVGRTRVEDG